MTCVWQDVGYQNTDFESSCVLIGYENQMSSKVMQRKQPKSCPEVITTLSSGKQCTVSNF